MTDNLKTAVINASTDTQQADRFNVRFLNIPENVSDLLSRQTQTITPRSFNFGTMTHATRRTNYSEPGRVEIEPMTMTILVDGTGMVDAILVAQVMRQKGMAVQAGLEEASKVFDLKIEYFNIDGEVTRSETYKRCFIQSLSRGELTRIGPMNLMYNLTLYYDEVLYEYQFGSGSGIIFN